MQPSAMTFNQLYIIKTGKNSSSQTSVQFYSELKRQAEDTNEVNYHKCTCQPSYAIIFLYYMHKLVI